MNCLEDIDVFDAGWGCLSLLRRDKLEGIRENLLLVNSR